MDDIEKSPKELRKFGLTMALICVVFSSIGIWKNGAVTGLALALLILSGLFIFFGIFLPLQLKTFEKLWMLLAEKINKIMTPIILTITYFLMITPIGLFLKLLGKDILELKIDKNRKSYWDKVDQSGSASRHNTPY